MKANVEPSKRELMCFGFASAGPAFLKRRCSQEEVKAGNRPNRRALPTEKRLEGGRKKGKEGPH